MKDKFICDGQSIVHTQGLRTVALEHGWGRPAPWAVVVMYKGQTETFRYEDEAKAQAFFDRIRAAVEVEP